MVDFARPARLRQIVAFTNDIFFLFQDVLWLNWSWGYIKVSTELLGSKNLKREVWQQVMLM